jgi:hypothetical protein
MLLAFLTIKRATAGCWEKSVADCDGTKINQNEGNPFNQQFPHAFLLSLPGFPISEYLNE